VTSIVAIGALLRPKTSIGAGRLALKSAPAMPMTLTVAPDNFSGRHHVLMIASPVAAVLARVSPLKTAAAKPTPISLSEDFGMPSEDSY
jgi:hypothetical protein